MAECSHSFLCSLTKALQNELSAARRLIDAYNFEKNPELRVLAKPPAPYLLTTNVRQLLNPDDSSRFDDVDPLQPVAVQTNMRIEKLVGPSLSPYVFHLHPCNIFGVLVFPVPLLDGISIAKRKRVCMGSEWFAMLACVCVFLCIVELLSCVQSKRLLSSLLLGVLHV